MKLLGVIGFAVVIGAVWVVMAGWVEGLTSGIVVLAIGILLLRMGALKNRPPVA